MPITESRITRQQQQREGKTFVVLEHIDSIGRTYMQILRDNDIASLRARLPAIRANFEARLKKSEAHRFLALVRRGEDLSGLPIEFNTTQELRDLVSRSVQTATDDITSAQAEKARLEANLS